MATKTKITISAQDKTKRAFKSVNNNMNSMGSNILSVRGKLLSLIGVGGMGALIKTSVDAADAIAKTADKLGIATDALQEYRFAAELTGVNQTALDTGLQRFTRRLAEADKGTGELAKTLTELNISTRNSDGTVRSAEAVLNDYADAIKGAESEQEQLRLAFKAFDTEGAAMVNTLRGGAEGLAALRQEARDAGVVMDEDLIRKAEIANNKWNTLAATIGTKFRSALIGALDVFVDLRDAESRLSDLNAEMEKTASNIRNIAEAGAATGLGPFAVKELERETAALKVMRLEHEKLTAQVQRDKDNKGGSDDSSGSSGNSDANEKAEKRTAELLQRQEEQAVREEQLDRERLASKFERLNISLLSEQERLRLGFEEKEFLIEESFQEGLINDQERKENLLAIEEDFQKRLTVITNKGMSERQKFVSKSAKDQTKDVVGELINLTHGVAQQNKVLFNINKVAGIANAIINTHEGVTRTLSKYPQPLAGILAAGHLAAGLAQVNAIKSASFGGGGGGGGSFGGGSIPPSSAGQGFDEIVGTQPAQQEKEKLGTINITVNGVLTQEIVDDVLVPAIREGVDDRDVILISGNSRNAQELVLA